MPKIFPPPVPIRWVRNESSLKMPEKNFFIQKNQNNSLLCYNRLDFQSTAWIPKFINKRVQRICKVQLVIWAGMTESHMGSPILIQLLAIWNCQIKKKRNPDLSQKDFSQKDHCNRESPLTTKFAGISKWNRKAFFFLNRGISRASRNFAGVWGDCGGEKAAWVGQFNRKCLSCGQPAVSCLLVLA